MENAQPRRLFFRFLEARSLEALLIVIVTLVAFLAFALAVAGVQLQEEAPILPALLAALPLPAVLVLSLFLVHFVLRWRGVQTEPVVWPIVGLLVALSLVLIWRLRGPAVVWQQLTRGWLPGLVVVVALAVYPLLLERLRRQLALVISAGGLLLLLATAFLGVVDESGARLSLKLGPLPPIQTAEVVKLSLIIFLAWYIERVGEEAEGRARIVGWLRLPSLKYFVPGTLFVFLATLALVRMSDFGAIPILGSLFVAMLYAGFQPRVFLTVAAIGLVLSVMVAIVLAIAWEPPAVIQQRLVAYRDPWSEEELVINGQPTGITVAEGPGYQIQQSVYAIIAGGISGTGLGLGSPQNVPLAHSDFIFAALVEELGAAVALALLACFAILLLRILRLAIMLPEGQLFERLLLVGISVHLFTQVFVMVGGTLNVIPPTGITVPFLSQGGVALLVNITEIGLVLALAQRLG
ncbi:MAG: FtsW/RodA/SpoVE family cell cycle protein [Chloroflexi bacterium]|nr:FtsW/RodA/SpoVE family cell cycle protein [Chloroflexota bacterium]MCI0575787.1 FtsW/RodA/SpoVE family cell cycle protein [Chloroflexota bacterium]MCI0647966.1 FtsW/RodA/SpoVE family cell cycle protein [Chloroflexota bacterium]MCI0726824.1 FtsW/RodA/SpoVE family cell cycle protein [Chloroflexota bacterium]